MVDGATTTELLGVKGVAVIERMSQRETLVAAVRELGGGGRAPDTPAQAS
jgi:hypothetical protein